MFQIIFRVRRLFREILIILFALNDRRTPWSAKVLILITMAYVVSPLDVIPDILLIVGLLDDFLIMSVLVTMCKNLIPIEVLNEGHLHIEKRMKIIKKQFLISVAFVVVLWAILIGLLIYFL